MITKGFTGTIAGPVVLDTPFSVDANTNLPLPSSYLYIGGVAGDVTYQDAEGNIYTMSNLGVGNYHPISCVQVNTAGTTASGIQFLLAGPY